MPNAIPRSCPACGQELHVCLLRCPTCRTEVQGDFLLERFARLDAAQLQFLETFLRCRGSLKDVGAAVGISYPTARNRLDALIEALGLGAPQTSRAQQRVKVLEQLKIGELTVEEALELIQGGKNDE